MGAPPWKNHAVDLADGMSAAFERAAGATDAVFEREVHIGDHAVRLQFAAPALAARLWPAFAAFARSSTTPDLTISCWDRSATGVEPPPAPFSLTEFLPNGAVRGHIDDRVRVAQDAVMRMVTVYDRERRHAWVCVGDHSLIPLWVDRAPFRTILRWWADDSELAPMHASAVAVDGDGVLVTGASGSGKSTTCLACVAAGWSFIADDFCMVTTGSDPMVHPVYGLAKLEPDALVRLPSLAEHVVDPSAEQLVLDPGANISRGARLRAVLIPQLGSTTKTSVIPISAQEVFRELVPGSVLEGIGAGTQTLGTLAALLRRVPCARLDLGSDLDGVVAALRVVISGQS
ncbi:MAG: hypothetical protein EXQ79_03965 [Acidimicrobiia bacterium]|nr:hypothetical protein [Acidimicrobiia bacterium]